MQTNTFQCMRTPFAITYPNWRGIELRRLNQVANVRHLSREAMKGGFFVGG